MGSSYNQQYVDATKYQADLNKEIALASNATDLDIAKLQSDAVIQQAKIDAEIREKELFANKEIQLEALRVREKEAVLQYKVDWKNAQNDAIRAEASIISANANMVEAEAEREDNEYDHEEYMARYDNSDSSYWYGGG